MVTEYSLVNGEFSSEEAKEILLNIIQEKIRFHDVQILRKKERHEPDFDRHLQRVHELKKSRDGILEMFSMDPLSVFKLNAVLTVERIKI